MSKFSKKKRIFRSVSVAFRNYSRLKKRKNTLGSFRTQIGIFSYVFGLKSFFNKAKVYLLLVPFVYLFFLKNVYVAFLAVSLNSFVSGIFISIINSYDGRKLHISSEEVSSIKCAVGLILVTFSSIATSLVGYRFGATIIQSVASY